LFLFTAPDPTHTYKDLRQHNTASSVNLYECSQQAGFWETPIRLF